jgi:hypothetical protein
MEEDRKKRQMKVKRRSNPCILVYQGNWRRLGAATADPAPAQTGSFKMELPALGLNF